MNVACPECSTVYRVDPARVPENGITTRCRECATLLHVAAGRDGRPGSVVTAEAVAPAPPLAQPEPAQSEPAAPDSEGPGEAVGAAPGAAEPTEATEMAEPPEGAEPPEATGDTRSPGSAATAGGTGGRPAAPVFGPQDPDTRARRLARALVSDIKVYNPDRWQQSLSEGSLRKDFRDEILKSWEEYVEQVGEPMAKKTPYFRDALNDILAEGQRVF